MTLAPIVLFVYNRPWHTRQTIEALQKNELASESKLFIYSDAAKTGQNKTKVQEVRDYIHSIGGFKKITIIEREENWGLANSIIDGVTSIVNQYGNIIILEDDLVTSPYFLTFMNDALDYYQNNDRVMHISGWNYPINTQDLPETVFLRGTSCWGWATWRRAWQSFEKKPQKLSTTFTKTDRYQFDYDGSADMWSQVTGNLNGKLNTWAIFWYAAVFKKGGLCLHPTNSLVENIGHDGSGVHCGLSDMYHNTLYNRPISYFSDDITENMIAMDRIKRFLLGNKVSFFERVLNKFLKNSMSSFNINFKKLINNIIGYFGYAITKVNDTQLPVEASDNDKNIMSLVRPYTMTSADRIWALINSMNYINESGILGDVVECGVWRGGSAMVIASKLKEYKRLDKKIWLYDTFQGMTEPSKFDVEEGSSISAVELLSKNRKEEGNNVWCLASKDDVINNLSKTSFPLDLVEIVEGDVTLTLDTKYPEKIALLRLDTDWYESTRKELEVLFPRLAVGGVCIIDDYGHWQGAKKAVDEYLHKNNIKVLMHKIDHTGRVFVKPEISTS